MILLLTIMMTLTNSTMMTTIITVLTMEGDYNSDSDNVTMMITMNSLSKQLSKLVFCNML